MPLGVPELLLILVIVLVLFGAKRLPNIGRQLGGGMREFRDSVRGRENDDDEDDVARPVPPALASGSEAPPAAPSETAGTPMAEDQDAPRRAAD